MNQPYKAYKKTSISWLPELPKHWDVCRAKYIFRKESRSVRAGDDVVTAFRNGEVTLRKKRREEGFTIALQEIGYQGIREGDLVIHGMDAFAGAIGVSDSDGKASPVYNVCTLRVQANVWYLCHAVREMSRSGFIQSLAKGIRERSTDFRFNTFGEQLLPLPPLAEQHAIANYLDTQSVRLDRFIAKKQALITLLKEQKAAIINELMCEDSRTEWRKLKFVIKGKLKYGANEIGVPFRSDCPRYIRITDFGPDGEIRDDDKLSLEPEAANDYMLKDGDILFARSGGTAGKTFQYRSPGDKNQRSCYAGYLIKAEADERIILSDFLFAFTRSGVYEQWKNGIYIKATIENISADKYAQLKIPLPSLNEQERILQDIRAQHQKIDAIITRTEREINLVKELQQSIIAEAVTGKINVSP